MSEPKLGGRAMSRRLHGFRCSFFHQPKQRTSLLRPCSVLGGDTCVRPPSKLWHYALFHGRGRKNWHSARFFGLRLFYRPFIPQPSAPSRSYEQISAGVPCRLSPAHPKPRPSARFHGSSRQNGRLTRISTAGTSASTFFTIPKLPTRSHGHI